MTTLTPLAHTFALSLGIPIGSPEWVAGGGPAWAASTGGADWYGFEHKQMVAQGKTRAILSNYAARSHWDPALLRQNSYEMAGIAQGLDWSEVPWIMVPSTYWQDPNKPERVSNQDLSHLHLGPLFAVYDHSAEIVDFLGAPVPAKEIASWAIRLSMASCAGMVRTTSPSWWVGDRAAANILKVAHHAVKRGLIFEQDKAALAKFFVHCLDRWEATSVPYQPDGAKHASMMTAPVVGDLTKFQMLPNGLYWWLPVLNDISATLTGDLAARVDKIIESRSKCILSLHKLTGHAAKVAGVMVPNGAYDWGDATVYYGPFLETWGARAMDVAAEVTGDASLKAYAVSLFKQATPEWAVTASGHYFAPVEPKL